jgi:transcriptional regulator with XRE-family HTH domain
MQMAALNNFRVNLRAAMECRELSQRAVADGAGCSYVYVNRVLGGFTDPTLPMCEKLSRAVGVDFGILILPNEKFKRSAKNLLTVIKR